MKSLRLGLVVALVAIVSGLSQAQTPAIVKAWGTCLVVTAPGMVPTAADREVLRTLEQLRVNLTFQDVPLSEVVEFLRSVSGLNVVLAGDVPAGEVRVTLKLRDVRLRTALELALEQTDLGYTVRDGVVRIGQTEVAEGPVTTAVFEAGDLLAIPTDFTGPIISLGRIGERSATPLNPWDPNPAPQTPQKTRRELMDELAEIVQGMLNAGLTGP